MHALLEFLPLIGLGGGYLIGKAINPESAMYYLAYGAIIGTLIQFAFYKIRQQKMQKTTLITGIALVVFSALTIILHNDFFIKIKPTIFSWGFSIIFLGYAYLKKKSLLEAMMGAQFELPNAKWMVLNWAWVIFNFLIGLVNLIILWKISDGNLSNDAWVSFKVALLPVTFVFLAGQMVYMFKNGSVKEDKKANHASNNEKEM